ncbi:MAG: glycosyltransferase family 8 protein [Candidatus Cryptobacteroides sp.]|nr:glycosyltransferase family 8 protein [Candidatus Cryptobacteroides sp.]
MNIVCATDDNFVQHCCIMLTSLLVNNRDVQIYVLTEGLTPDNQKIIREEVTDKGGRVEICIVDSSIVEKFPMPKENGVSHISRATYYRLLMAELLPSTLEKVIYLDCDIIINDSIEDLWNVNIDNYAIAASLQVGYGYEAIRLGYPIEYGYFNAGVNIVNLKYWRDNNVRDSLMAYIAENSDSIKYHDQDTLNAVLFDKCYHIMPQWNMTSLAYSLFLASRGDSRFGKIINTYQEEKKNIKANRWSPIVLHYVSKPKPWNDGCVHPLYMLYYKYARKTLHFSDIEPQNDFKRKIMMLKDYLRQLLSYFKQMIHKTDPTRL